MAVATHPRQPSTNCHHPKPTSASTSALRLHIHLRFRAPRFAPTPPRVCFLKGGYEIYVTAAGTEGHPNEVRAFYNAGKEEGYVWLFMR